MSIEHFRAAWKCRKFKGSTRLLLLALANRASDGKPSKLGRVLPAGWSFAGSARLMMDTAIQSRDTLIASMKELLDSKVIQRKRRLGRTTLTFVNIDVLKGLAYTEEDKEDFRKRAEAYTKKHCLSSSTELSEETLPLDVGNAPTCDAGEFATSRVGNGPTIDAGKPGADNPQVYPKVSSPQADYPPASESASADTETDDDLVSQEREGPNEEDYESPVPAPADGFPVLADKESGSHGSFVERPSPSSAAPLPAGGEPSPQEYADVVYLCSLWRATHQGEVPESHVPSDDDPVNWTADRRRRTFRALMEREAKQPTPAPTVSSPDLSEDELWYQDEEAMLKLYLANGRENVERVIKWLPCSDFWNTPQNKPESIAALGRAWPLVERDCEKYFNRASETGTSVACDLYVQKRFDAAGGSLADRICDDRLNPVDPEDAAIEAAVDAFDDAFGVDVGFYPDRFITFPPGYRSDKYGTESADMAEDSVSSGELDLDGNTSKE